MDPAFKLPRVYPVIDAARFAAEADPADKMAGFAEELIAGGATLVQYRRKSGDDRSMFLEIMHLREVTMGKARLIINDRLDLCLAALGDGVHLGQDDLSPKAARRIFETVAGNANRQEQPWIGFSRHNRDQVREAGQMPVDYIAVGPVFATSSKTNPDPVIGLEGVREARRLTSKPLVAIGGINRSNCRQVIGAGADCVAIISDLVESPRARMDEFLRILR